MSLNNLYRNPIYRTEKPFPPIEFYIKFMFFPDPVLNWNQIDVFVPGRLVILYREMSMPGCHSRVTRHRPTSADILNIPDTREISSNDGHLQPPSDPQINCTTGWTLLT